MRKRTAITMLFLIALFAGVIVHGHTANASNDTLMKVVNPLTGDQWFNFTTMGKSVGDTFIINITVADVTNLAGWQFRLDWNSSMLTFVKVTIPSDNIFANKNIISGIDDTELGRVYGLAYMDPWQTINASGILAQVELRIVQSLGESPISLGEPHTDTLLIDGDHNDISFTTVNGYYKHGQGGGDVNNDGIVNMRDVNEAISAFNSFPSTSRWNSYADVDYSGRVDMRDLVLVVLNFNKHE